MYALALLFFLASLWLPNVRARLVNRTIDDRYGDPEKNINVQYSPPSGWADGEDCLKCGINSAIVNTSMVFNGTWHDATARIGGGTAARMISVEFNGSAVYVFNLVANTVKGGSTTTFTNLTFHLDGELVGNFTHSPISSAPIIEYDVTVYSNSSLEHTQHTLDIMSASDTADSLILFDYIVYTTDEDDIRTGGNASALPSTKPPSNAMHTSPATASPAPPSGSRRSSKVGIIAGSAVTALAIMATAVLVLLFMRYRKAARLRRREEVDGLSSPPPTPASPRPRTASRTRLQLPLHPPWNPAPFYPARTESRNSLLSQRTSARTASSAPDAACVPSPPSIAVSIPIALFAPDPVPQVPQPRIARLSPPAHSADVPASVFTTTDTAFASVLDRRTPMSLCDQEQSPPTPSSSRLLRLEQEMASLETLCKIEQRLSAIESRLRRATPRRRHSSSTNEPAAHTPRRYRRRGSVDVPVPPLSVSGSEASARLRKLQMRLRRLKEERREGWPARKQRRLELVNARDDVSEPASSDVHKGASGRARGDASALYAEIEVVRREIAAAARLVDESLPSSGR